MTMSFHADAQAEGTTAVLRMRGELNATADVALLAAHDDVVAGGADELLLDFTEVDYINSSGIALIVTLLIDAQRAHRHVRAAGLSAHYRHIFEITRLTDYLVLDDDGNVPTDDGARTAREEAAHG
jgi:anti-anti-sigma factor